MGITKEKAYPIVIATLQEIISDKVKTLNVAKEKIQFILVNAGIFLAKDGLANKFTALNEGLEKREFELSTLKQYIKEQLLPEVIFKSK